MKYFIVSVCFFFTIYSCNRELKIINLAVGSNYSVDGIINEKNLNFDFMRFKDKKNLQDFVDAVYFAGDTICFSILLNKKKSENIKFKSYYIGGDKSILREYKERFYNNHMIPVAAVSMERVDYFENRISGFSLVGSVLEHTYKKELLNKVDTLIFSEPHYVLYMFVINNKLYKSVLIKFYI